MKILYVILSSIGWAWLVVLFGLLWVNRKRTDPGGFEVRNPKENN